MKGVVYLNWSITDQLFVEDLVKKSGVSYSEFIKWIFSVVERSSKE